MEDKESLNVLLYILKKVIVLLSFLLCSTVYSIYDTGKGHRTDVSSAL